MNLTTVLNYARTQTQTDSNGLNDANGIIFANEAQKDIKRRFVQAGVDAAQIQESYMDLTAGVGTYLYPTDLLFLKAIELDFTGSGGSNYRTASQVDISNLPGSPVASFSWQRANASTQYPLFDDHGDWFEVFPTPQSTYSQGIRIFYFQQATNFTSTGDTVPYPYNLDEALLGFRIAANYKRSLSDLISAADLDKQYMDKVKEYIDFLSRGTQQPIQATRLQLTGFEF